MKTNPYDSIPYTKHVYQQTQPNTLATLAILFGMRPPPVETCRVLELGCASGINTIAMAQAIPNGEFIGVDFSEQQIREGQENISRLGLPNIQLKPLNITRVDFELGMFDYIVAHGVYSWVPPVVRDKILQICCEHLQPNGVAYVSYNIYPGWHLDRVLREMMLYRTRGVRDPQEKLEQAKALVNFFIESIKHKYDSYSLWLKKELQHISQLNDNYLAHEYLEEHNEPVFFHEFIEHAQRHGLQYITDTRVPFVSIDNFGLPAAEAFDFDDIEIEQYMDFLRNNPFRESLLCHQEIVLNRHLELDRISDFHIAAPLKPASTPQSPVTFSESLKEEMLERFENLAGEAVLSVASPLLKAVCLCLGEMWPQSLSFDELMARVYELLIMTDQETYYEILSPENISEIKTMLAQFYLKKIVELSIYPPQFNLHVSDCPLASPLARLQSQQGKQVTNLRYEIFTLSFATRQVLSHLDGKHDRAALLEVLRQSVIKGDLVLYRGEEQKTLIEVDDDELHNLLSSQLDEILPGLAHKAYLIN